MQTGKTTGTNSLVCSRCSRRLRGIYGGADNIRPASAVRLAVYRPCQGNQFVVGGAGDLAWKPVQLKQANRNHRGLVSGRHVVVLGPAFLRYLLQQADYPDPRL